MVAVELHERTQFSHEAEGVRLCVHVERTGTVQVVPLSLIVALLELKSWMRWFSRSATIDQPVTVAADVMHEVETAWICAGFAPGEQMPAIGRIFVHTRVPITVGNVDVAVRRQSGMRAAAERPTAHRWSRTGPERRG